MPRCSKIHVISKWWIVLFVSLAVITIVGAIAIAYYNAQAILHTFLENKSKHLADRVADPNFGKAIGWIAFIRIMSYVISGICVYLCWLIIQACYKTLPRFIYQLKFFLLVENVILTIFLLINSLMFLSGVDQILDISFSADLVMNLIAFITYMFVDKKLKNDDIHFFNKRLKKGVIKNETK